MAVSMKGRRKIIVEHKLYLWKLGLDEYGTHFILNIVSEDKSLILSCPIDAPTPYIISLGNLFQQQKTSGRWQRYLLPFSVPEIVTPRFVATLIKWATEETDAVEISWEQANDPLQIPL